MEPSGQEMAGSRGVVADVSEPGTGGRADGPRSSRDAHSGRDPRELVWQPSQKLPWHLAFYGVLGVTLLAVVPDLTPTTWPAATWRAVVALAALALAYGVLLIPGEPPMASKRVFVYLSIMVVALSIAIANATFATLMLFLGFTHTWALTGSRAIGTAFTGALALGAGLGVAFADGFGAGVIVGAAVAVASFAFSVAMGLSILSLVQRSFERQRLAADLAVMRQQLAEARWAEKVTAERERIAQDIHDTLAQGFTSIVMLAQVTRSDIEARRSTAAVDRLDLIEQTARENLAEARALVTGHAPPSLADEGLAAAIERLASRFEAETGVSLALNVDVRRGDAGADRGRDVVLLRACQEALANVRKHARARRVAIDLSCGAPGARLVVTDDGGGLPDPFVPGIGLDSMAARAGAIGGSLSVRANPSGPGTILDLRLPPPGTAGPARSSVDAGGVR